MGPGRTWESSSIFNSSVMTMAFMPVTVSGKTIYAPIQTASVAPAA